ncbi:Ig-like domain-containing protein [Pontibacter fetidus]|uniref:Gliding motility-associated C-terminal domain-containing protein n=1 Tax=Pontibacter fetidus TaxID=2700082 RepID=A0A6B2GXL6_9BACT|nr:gliding motility-associated C-terminal domain-containing protein [Pontibacter fetidus]NDK54598.1 gliding motility-associated C-terminal domain-containing protein [Pontibacter fetidus]
MRILLPLLLTFLLLGFAPTAAFSQCQPPTVTLPADIGYCGPRTIAFTTTNAAHTPVYSNDGGTLTYSWKLNGTVVATSAYPSINFPTPGTHKVTITVTKRCGKFDVEIAEDTQLITIEAIPDAPDVESMAVCTGSNATLWVNNADPNLLYKWYNKNTGALLVWGTSYTMNNASYMQVEVEALTASGCTSARTTATITTSLTNGNATVLNGNQEICAGTRPATITGNAPQNMTFQWLQSTTGSGSGYSPIASATDKSYSPPPLYQTTWYKRVAYNGGCGEETNPVKVTVTPIPATPIVSDRLVCYGERAMFTVANNDGNTIYNWYATATSTTMLGTGPTFITPQAVTGPVSYYVEATTTAQTQCYSTIRVEVKANSTPQITNNSITANQAMCTGGKPEPLIGTMPTGGGGGYIYQWQQSTDGGNTFIDVQGANAKDFAPASLKVTTWFRRKVKAASTCPETISNAIVVTVTPMPATIDIDEPMICYGSSASIIVTNPEPDFTYRWYDVAEGGTLLATGTTFTTTPLTSNKTYYVEATSDAGCYSVRRSVDVTVTPLPPKPTAANVTICEGSGATLAVDPTDASIFYRWYNSNNNLLATGNNYVTAPLTINTTYYVEAVTKASPGCASPKVAVEVIVTPKIANNAISADQVLCSGSTPAALQGTVPTGGGGGYTYQWEYSVDGSLFYTITGATGMHYAPGSLTATTWYRRKVTASGSCPTSISNLVKIVVNPLPGTPLADNVAICTGTAAALSVNSPDANYTYKWYATATGGAAIATGTTFNTGVLTSGKVYYVEAISATGCISSSRRMVTVSVKPLPATPAADDAAICAGSIATLSVLAPDVNLVYRWYDSDTGGTLLATGTNYTTEPLTETTIFYVEASTAEGCTSNDRKAVYVNVTPLPAIPDVDNTTICSGDAAVLFVKNPDPTATYNWYLGGSLLASGVTFTTDILAYSTTFHVEAVSNTATACTSPARRAAIVTVTPNIDNNSISSAQTICSGGTPYTLTGTQPTGGSGAYVYQWERSEDGSNFTSIAGAVNSTYSPGTLTISTWFRRKVRAASGSCPEHVSNAVKVTVSPLPTTPLAQNSTVCYGERAQLSITSPDASLTYKWYTTASGGSPVGVGPTLTTESLTATTTYYVDATNTTGCVSNRRAITATVRALPEMPQAADKTICAGRNATLSVSNPDPTLVYRWFNTSGDLLATGTTYTTANLSATATYYIEASTVTSPVCTSARKAVVVSVSPMPTMPAAEDVAICTGGSAQLSVISPDVSLTYKWYTSATGGTAIGTGTTYTTGSLTSASTYYLEAVTAAGCVSSRSQVNVTVTPLPATPTADNVAICAGAPATLTVKDPSANLSYRWYTAATGGTLLATGNTYAIGSVAATTTFYIEAVTTGGCASTSRGTVTVQVTPLPATPNADNATVCAGNSTTLWVKNPEPGLIYRWYEGGTQVATGISYTTAVLNYSATYQLEAVTNNSTACVSASRRTVSVTVTPAITNNIISDNQTICSGSTPAPFTGTLPAGDGSDFSYQWERSEDGVNFSVIANAIGQSYAAGTLNTTTWFRRRVKANNNCPEHISNVIKVTINALPATPQADNTTTCEGSTTTLSVKNPDSGYTYRWYTVASGGTILAVGNTITTPAVNATTTYYVEASNASGCLSPRKAVTVTVTPLPTAPTVADRSICMNEQAILAVTNPSANLTYRWYDNSGTLVGSGPSYTTNALTDNKVFYVESATIATPSCVSNRSTVIVNVTPLPATPQANDATVCSGSAADLTIKDVDPNLTYKWYGTAAGGTPLHTGSTYRTTTLTSNRTYYIEAVNAAGCSSQERKAVAVTVVPIPAVPAVANATICAGTGTTLSVASPDASLTYRWYDTSGNLLASGSFFNTGILNKTTTYAVEAAALATSGCASSRKNVTVTVTPLPAAPEVNQPTVCAGTTATLFVNNPVPSVDYRWYDENEALITSGTSYTTEALTESTIYYVEAVTSNGCASLTKQVVSVTVVQPVSNNIIGSDQTICSGSMPATLTGSLPNGSGNYSYQWERSEDGINFTAISNATTQNYTPGALNITTWFRREVKTTGPCAEHSSNTIRITITPIPSTAVADNATICEGSTATLTVKDVTPGYTYRWYTTPVGGGAIVSGSSFTTGALETTTTFYVEAVNATGCSSARRTVTVTVMPQPEAPSASDVAICAGEQATLAIENVNASLTYRWFDGNGTLLATGTTYTTAVLNSNSTYYVEAVTSGTPSCVSGRTSVAVNVATRPATPLADDASVCAGTAAQLSVKSVIPGITYKWYTVATGGTPVFIGSNYTTAALTSDRTYYVEAATASGCTSVNREAVVVKVIQQPAMPVVADRTVCAGSTVVLSVTNPDANLMYRWYDQSGAALATGTTYTSRALTASTLYYVEAVTTTSPGCTSARETVNVTVTPLPATPVADNATICAGATATLYVKNATPAVVYKWYDDTETLLFTGTTFTTPTLTADAIYYVEASSGAGCVNQARTVVTVYVTQPITNNNIATDQTICSGDVPVKLTGTQAMGGGGNITYQWESSEDGINFNLIVNATGKDYQPEALHVTTWFRRRATIPDGLCPDQVSNIIKVRAIPLPSTPVASNITICAGAKAILSVSPENGYTYRWFSVASGGTSLATGTMFSVEGLQSETRYYVEAVNGNGCISPRKQVTVFVTPLPATPQANDQLICAGGKATLFVTDPDVKLNYRWLDSNGNPVANGSSFTTGNLTQNTIYYLEAYTTTTQACTSQRKAVTVNVQQLPGTPEVDNAIVCAGTGTTLTVKQANTGYTYKWYSVATGGVPLATGQSFETGALTSDRTYFVEAVNSSACTSSRTPVKVTVTPQPATPLANNAFICAGETVTLAVINPDMTLNYRWYDGAGKLLATGNTHAVSGLKASTTYYVEAISGNGCVSPARKAVVVSVAQLPATPVVSNASSCSGETVTLFVKNPDPALQYRWYEDATGTILLGSGVSYTSANALYTSRSYFVEAVNTAGCSSATKAQADVLVTTKPGTPVVQDATICSGGTATLTIVQPDAALVYKWFDANGTLLRIGTTYTTVPLSSKATFYVTAYTSSGPACAGPSEAVTVNIMTSLANNTVTGNQTICSGANPSTLSGSLPTGGGNTTLSYQWERSQDGINFVSIVGAYAQDYAPEALTADTWFRRVVKAAGPCSESISNAVKVSVTPLPATPLADDVTVCAGSSASLSIKNPSTGASNITYRWYYTASGGTAIGTGISFTTQPLYANSTYYVEAVNSTGCVSSARRAITITVIKQITDNTVSSAQTICSGGTPVTITGSVAFQGADPYSYQWQQSTDGINYTNISGATGQHYIPTQALTRNTWYRRVVRSAGPCGDHTSNAVKMEVVPLPVAPTIASVSVCPGSSATLQATNLAPGTRLEWYDSPQGGTYLGEGTTFTTSPYTTTSYWVQALNSTSCESPTRKEVKIIVVDPQVRVSGDVTIMQGKATKLVASGGATYSWSPATGLSDATIATPIAKPEVTTTYTVTMTTAEGCTSSATITVNVVPAIVPMNAMTPNGDGINDVFYVENLDKYPDCRVEIFTRWGEKVFESKGYTEPWNGTRNGKPMPLGAYYYIIYLSRDEAPISGSITIIK